MREVECHRRKTNYSGYLHSTIPLPVSTMTDLGSGSPPALYRPPSLRTAPPAPTPAIRSNAVQEKSEEAPAEAILGDSPNVTVRRSTRPRQPRAVSPIPDDSVVITPARQTKKLRKRKAKRDSHRPAPQVQEHVTRDKLKATVNTTTAPDVTLDTGSSGDAQGTRGGARAVPLRGSDGLPPCADRQENMPAPVNISDAAGVPTAPKPTGKPRVVSAKKERYLELRNAAAATASLDDLATVLGDTISAMRLLKGAPTIACLDLLDEIHARLTNHHEYPCVDESRESFASVVTRAVSVPVKSLATQVEAQQRAIATLTKTVETLKNAPVLAAKACGHGSFASVTASPAQPKPKTSPLPNPEDERILVRFDGVVPSLLSLPYPRILATLNEGLSALGLPLLLYTQKHSDASIFIVPSNKDDLRVLTERWSEWGPTVLPGGRVAPVATHCFLQVDGVPFAGAGTLEELAHGFEERNPQFGPVVSISWVNKPPSEAKAAAMSAAGKKPPKAGSLFIRLQSREMVDKAVAVGRVILAGTAPTVGRGFPHLRVVQCWGCLKYGHTRDRCSTAAKCGGCGKDNHGVTCAEKPVCVNCGGLHRADSFACPARKRIAEDLRLRAAALCKVLDSQSRYNKPLSPLSPLLPTLGLSGLTSPSTNAPRLHEQF